MGREVMGENAGVEDGIRYCLWFLLYYRYMKTNFRTGRTIAGDSRRNHELELKRLEERKKRSRKMWILGVGISLIVILLLFWLVWGIKIMIEQWQASQQEEEVLTATVQILDENKGTEVSTRVNEFVARLENDVKDYGLVVDHVVLPFQKAREIDVYLVGRTEYYKMSLDRGSAVQAEDAWRMTRYLDEKGITSSYVDLRVEGKAYYK